MPISQNFIDSEGFEWDFRSDRDILIAGQSRPVFALADGQIDAVDNGFTLFVNGKAVNPQAASLDATGRELNTQAVLIDGIGVTRSIHVSDSGTSTIGFARFLDSFSNYTDTTQTVTVQVVTNSGADAALQFPSTTSGDATLTNEDFGFTTDDANLSGNDTALTYAYGDGANGTLRPSDTRVDLDTITVTYTLTLAPGETKSLLQFATQNTVQSAASADLPRFTAPSLDPAFLTGLSAAERQTVVNYASVAAPFTLTDADGHLWAIDARGGLSTFGSRALVDFNLAAVRDNYGQLIAARHSTDGREVTLTFGGMEQAPTSTVTYTYTALEDQGVIRLLVSWFAGTEADISLEVPSILTSGATPALLAAQDYAPDGPGAGRASGVVLDDSDSGSDGTLPALVHVFGAISDQSSVALSGSSLVTNTPNLVIPQGQTVNFLYFFSLAETGLDALADLTRLNTPGSAALAGLSQETVAAIRNFTLDETDRVRVTEESPETTDALDGHVGHDSITGFDGDTLIRAFGADDTVAAGAGFDTVFGGTGEDLLLGGSEDDVLHGEAGRDALYGDAGADWISGGDGDDILDGGEDDDTLHGGAGNDLLIGGPGQDVFFGGAGNDTISGTDAFDGSVARGGSGDDVIGGGRLSNHLSGGLGHDLITGNTNNDTILGGADNDTIEGQDGADLIFGGTGADSMTGGDGGDTYSIDDVGDVVVELADGTGTDRVESTITFALAGLHIESLILTGTDAINGSGSEQGNLMSGNQADNLLSGLGGADTLFGNSGNDTLNGGAGADQMSGGSGSDVFIVNNAGDRVLEDVSSDPDESDLVQSTVSFSLEGQHLEVLALFGMGNLTGTGNDLANRIIGNSGRNALFGGQEADTLEGGAGADTLDGGTGGDRMLGGTGGDTFVIDDILDRIIERATDAGTDTVQSSLSFNLGMAHLENLMLTGASAIDGTGNGLNNRITGNAARNILSGNGGNDTLAGGLGSDRLIGGGGADTFLFNTALDASNNVDRIVDFGATDVIRLSAAIFTALAPGALPATRFALGTTAADRNDMILYDAATGRLFYDADGNRSGAAIHFATVGNGFALTHENFLIG